MKTTKVFTLKSCAAYSMATARKGIAIIKKA